MATFPTRISGILVSLLFLAGLASASAAYGTTFVVDPTTGGSVSPGDLATTTELVKTSVTELGYTLTDNPGEADYLLKPKLLRLGEAYILTIEKLDHGKVKYSTQLKAAHLDELDKVAKRVTRSVIVEEQTSSDRRVGEVTDQEAKDGMQRRPARHLLYLGFGGAWLSNLANDNLGYSFGAAWAWDVNRAIIKILGDGAFSGSAFMITTALGADIFLTLTDIAPYLGADFGFAFSKSDGGGVFAGQTTDGFQVGLDAGIQFLRTAVISVDIGGRLGFLLSSNSFGKPTVLSLRLGLYF